MGSVSVDQVLVTPLQRIAVNGGEVLHGMKRDDPGYVDFGEVYFSMIEPGAIKAWKRHLHMTLNLVVPVGKVCIAFIDQSNAVREEILGLNRHVRISVPPGLWFGFKGLAKPYSMLVNIADIPHNPAEVERKEIDEMQFDWENK